MSGQVSWAVAMAGFKAGWISGGTLRAAVNVYEAPTQQVAEAMGRIEAERIWRGYEITTVATKLSVRDSGSRSESQDRETGLGPQAGRTAPVEGYRP